MEVRKERVPVAEGLPNVRKERFAVVGVARQGGDHRPSTVQLLALLDVTLGQGSVQPHAGGLRLPRTDGVGMQRRLHLSGVGGWGLVGRD